MDENIWKSKEDRAERSGVNVIHMLKEKVHKHLYLVHVYNIYRQFAELKHLKDNLKENQAIVTVEFSRNYDNKQAKEIQSAYFSHDTFTIYTAACYWKEGGELKQCPLAIVSNEAQHDKNVAFTCNQQIIEIS